GALILSVAGASDAPAQATDPGGAFVKDLVTAINSKSPDRRKALLHPTSLSCTSGEAGAFHDQIVTRQARRPVPADYKWKITPIPADQPLMFADQFDYPIRPTHLLQLDFQTEPRRSTTMIFQLVHDANQWREMTPCPKPETIAAARAAKDARAKHAEKVQALAASTPTPLREAVVRLFKEGRRVEAFKHYASVTGEDLATAKDVVELLAGHSR
ncbi:MAG: hypothetical protein Q8S13_09415, partial [Dehalococcoidia bacterium]|nr:hypothetical protein [Dehalococcoidia bacterium]